LIAAFMAGDAEDGAKDFPRHLPHQKRKTPSLWGPGAIIRDDFLYPFN
jgi:hypothetical protein